jgi:hypothetical protein
MVVGAIAWVHSKNDGWLVADTMSVHFRSEH